MEQQPPPSGSPPFENASSSGDVAREQGEQFKDEVTEQTKSVAGTVADEASHVVHDAAGHVRDLAADAKKELHRQGREQTENLGGAIGHLGEHVHALAEGRPAEAGAVGDYATRIADQIDEVAGRVGDLGFDGMFDEMQRFARRRPGAFLAGAAVAGFAVSRLGRGVHASQQEQGRSGTPSGGSSAIQASPAAASALPNPSSMPAGPGTATTPPPDTSPTPEVIDLPREAGATPGPRSSGQVRR